MRQVRPLTLAEAHNNLDLFCASQGHFISKTLYDHILGTEDSTDKKKKASGEAENLITRTLGVLQGQGIYATFLLLASRKKKPDEVKEKPETILRCGLRDFISCINAAYVTENKEILDDLRDGSILSDISTLLLVKRTMERALTYARYHAKARGGE